MPEPGRTHCQVVAGAGELTRRTGWQRDWHIDEVPRPLAAITELKADIVSVMSGVDSVHVGLVLLGQKGDVRQATADALPPLLQAWVRHHETSTRDGGAVPAPRSPYVVERDDRRLVISLIGEHPRLLLALHEERLGVDEQALGTLGLTRREAEVLKWVAEGKRDQEIAVILAISPRTVQHHLGHIYDKLGVEPRSGAVAVALRTSENALIPS